MRLGKTELPSDRVFGLFGTAVAAAFGAFYVLEGRFSAAAAIGLVAVFAGAATLLRPRLLRPLNKAWMMLGLALARVVSPIVLGILFFGLFTPLALLLRMSGRDELRLRRPPAAETYWRLREPPGPGRASFRRQF